jgi:HK97 gp10 family phage protein
MAKAVRVRIEGLEELRAQLRKLGREARAVLVQAAYAGAEEIRQEAEAKAPGPYIEKEKNPKGKNTEILIGPDREHWYYLFAEMGTDPHEIKPRKKGGKKALAFEGLVRRSVNHPGSTARPFLRPAVDSAKGRATDAVGKVIKRVVESV